MTVPLIFRRRLITAFFGIVTVAAIGLAMRNSDLDLPVTFWFNSHFGSGFTGSAATALYAALKVPYSIALTLVLGGTLAGCSGQWRLGLRYILTVAATWLSVMGLKLVFARPRPPFAEMLYPPSVIPADLSFPSGHTNFLVATTITILLSISVIRQQTHRNQLPQSNDGADFGKFLPRFQWILWPALAAVLIGYTVLTTGVHHLTDWAASIIWAITVTPAIFSLWGLILTTPTSTRT